MSIDINIWRLQTRKKDKDAAPYCLDNNAIAMGWPINNTDDLKKLQADCNYDNYISFAQKEYRSVDSVKRMVNDIRENDIVWMRYKGQYYFARITNESKWYYNFNNGDNRNNVYNCLSNVYWHLADKNGDEASVPGCINNAFIKGSTFQRINKQVKEYCQMLYNEIVYEDNFKYTDIDITLSEQKFWDLLHDYDAEDLLCMWLYKTKGYIVIPSTNKRATELYECVMIDPNSSEQKNIYIQAKKGDCNIDSDDYEALNGEVYLLSTQGKITGNNVSNVFAVDPKIIYEFAINQQNASLIPKGIKKWIDFLKSPNDK